MAKRASETDQDGILDAAFYHRGGESGWAAFGNGRLDPGELLARVEEGGDDVDDRAGVLSVMLDLCLGGWGEDGSPEYAGRRVAGLATALGHGKALELGVAAMYGARELVGGSEECRVARGILDVWLWDNPTLGDLGKRVVVIGRFFNHAEVEGWSLRDLAKAFGESRTWTQKRVQKECNKPIEASGGKGHASWQQSPGQRANSSAAQRKFHATKNNKKPNYKNDDDR